MSKSKEGKIPGFESHAREEVWQEFKTVFGDLQYRFER